VTQKRNMYGCLPCSKCGSKYCTPYQRETLVIECGDCGRVVPARLVEDGEAGEVFDEAAK